MDAARPLTPPGFESGPPAENAARATPVMEQYIEIKSANPDCLLFYRMGDFYELFFEDAEIAARALGIVLTKRGKHLGRDIPMCGVPIHRADEYLNRLIALGHRVAVCEQIEDPAEAKKRGGKSVVRRDVIRVVTPGTLTEDTLLDARRNNYLLAIARARASLVEDSRFALAWIDISTGEFRIAERDRAGLAAALAARARGARGDACDRPGDAQQSRACARALGRAPRLIARRDRPHGDGCGLAAPGAAPCRSAHRPRRDRAAPRRHRIFRGRCCGTRRAARAARGGARSRPRAGAARPRPRRPPRPRRHARRHSRRRRHCRRAGEGRR